MTCGKCLSVYVKLVTYTAGCRRSFCYTCQDCHAQAKLVNPRSWVWEYHKDELEWK